MLHFRLTCRPLADIDAESKMLEDAVARRSQEFKRLGVRLCFFGERAYLVHY